MSARTNLSLDDSAFGQYDTIAPAGFSASGRPETVGSDQQFFLLVAEGIEEVSLDDMNNEDESSLLEQKRKGKAKRDGDGDKD